MKIERTATDNVWRLTRELYKWNGSERVPLGSETAMVELEVDAPALAQFMALRALGSKRGFSVMQDGIITARVLSRQSTEAPR